MNRGASGFANLARAWLMFRRALGEAVADGTLVPLAWWPCQGYPNLKLCPCCRNPQLEGAVECFDCGGGPFDDRTWRGFPVVRPDQCGRDAAWLRWLADESGEVGAGDRRRRLRRIANRLGAGVEGTARPLSPDVCKRTAFYHRPPRDGETPATLILRGWP